MYKIFFYKTTHGKELITDFIDSFSNKIIIKIRSDIRLLEEYGLSLLSTSKVKKLANSPDLYELRVKSTIQIRFLFVFIKPNIFLFLHGFIKKTNKIPSKEIKIAISRLKEFDI